MLSVPLINPLRFAKYGYSDNYNTKYFDLYQFPQTIRSFEQQTNYYQPFNLDDPLVLYVVTNDVFASISANFYTSLGVVYSQNFGLAFSYSIGMITYSVFTISIDLNSVGQGIYNVRVTDGTTTIESNTICIEDSHPETVLIKYRSDKHFEDVIYEKLDSSFYFYLRVQGYVKHNLPERVATTYEDQVLNMTMLKAVPYNSWSYITDSSGIPTYVIDLLNRVFGSSTLYLDNRGFTVPDSAKWEAKDEEFYPLRGWGIDLREKLIQSSLGFDGSTGGVDTPPADSKKELFSDWWATTPGTDKLTGSQTSSVNGYRIDQIDEIKTCARSGDIRYPAATSTPGNNEYYHDTGADQVKFDSTTPFNSGETVFMIITLV